jgi:hypothetical protein
MENRAIDTRNKQTRRRPVRCVPYWGSGPRTWRQAVPFQPMIRIRVHPVAFSGPPRFSA